MQKLGFISLIAGIATAAIFIIISGMHYRYMEDRGLDPGYTPQWILLGTEFGLLLFTLGVIILLGNLLISFIRKAKARQ